MKPFKNLTVEDLKKIEEQVNYPRMSESTVGKEINPEMLKQMDKLRSQNESPFQLADPKSLGLQIQA